MSSYPDAYIQYLVHFHGDRDWFECHEILEEYWKSQPQDARSKTWVGLIQIAVGLYHQRRGNRAGALKMLESAQRNLDSHVLDGLGLDGQLTMTRIQERCKEIEVADPALPFTDLNLPIADGELLNRCLERCDQMQLQWEAPSRLEERQLVYKHTLRDRTKVIETRRTEAELRRLKRGSDR
jgi:uncharacterized protein